jgi:MoaA/NifB/PqqE/SkfB family radical SAM enzyme
MQTDEVVTAFNSQFSVFAADEVAWEVRPEMVDVELLASSLKAIRRRSRGGRLIVTETPYLDHREIAVWYQNPKQFVKYNTTRCAWIRMKVWPDGKVKPCRAWQIGDVAEQHAMEIWNGQEFQDFRQTLAAHGTLAICARCCYLAHR